MGCRPCFDDRPWRRQGARRTSATGPGSTGRATPLPPRGCAGLSAGSASPLHGQLPVGRLRWACRLRRRRPTRSSAYGTP
eukprot:5901711-Pyramimonas_sp.AAC.1